VIGNLERRGAKKSPSLPSPVKFTEKTILHRLKMEKQENKESAIEREKGLSMRKKKYTR